MLVGMGDVPSNPSLLDVAGDIPMPEVVPQLSGNIFIPVVNMTLGQPATPAGYATPSYTAPEKGVWQQMQDWATANKQTVMIAAAAIGAMVLFGGKKR